MKITLSKLILIITFLITLAQGQPTASDSCVYYNSDNSVCTGCLQGLYLEYFFCIPCNPLCYCTNTTSNYCQGCLNVTIQNRKYMSIRDGDICKLCVQYIPNCLECTVDGFICKRCMMGRYLIQGQCSNITCDMFCQLCQNQNTCQQCLPGYYLNSSQQCIQSNCTSNCSVCNDQISCLICDATFIQINGTCQPCIQFCAICINTTLCQVCLPSYLPVNGTCQATNISNCIGYNGGIQSPTCLVCEPGYYNAQGSCTQCSGCLLCTQAFLCQTPCYEGYVQFNFACIQFQRNIILGVGLIVSIFGFFLVF